MACVIPFVGLYLLPFIVIIILSTLISDSHRILELNVDNRVLYMSAVLAMTWFWWMGVRLVFMIILFILVVVFAILTQTKDLSSKYVYRCLRLLTSTMIFLKIHFPLYGVYILVIFISLWFFLVVIFKYN